MCACMRARLLMCYWEPTALALSHIPGHLHSFILCKPTEHTVLKVSLRSPGAACWACASSQMYLGRGTTRAAESLSSIWSCCAKQTARIPKHAAPVALDAWWLGQLCPVSLRPPRPGLSTRWMEVSRHFEGYTDVLVGKAATKRIKTDGDWEETTHREDKVAPP